MRKGIVIVVGPSGVGKSSFVDKVVTELPYLVDIVTYTTRDMRPGEKEGAPYHYVSKEKFRELIEEDFFVEWAHVHSNMYGTPRDQINRAFEEGKCVIMDLDVQGAQTFMKEFPEALTVFITPPSIDELRRRVLGRNPTPPKDFEIRMENAKKEMAMASMFKVQIQNDDFSQSYGEFKKIIDEFWQNG